MTEYRVIGIDPSLASTGIAYANGELTNVKTEKSEGVYRLQPIYNTTFAAAGSGYWKGTKSLAVVEDLPRNAMGAGLTGQAQGCVRLAIANAGISMLTIAPATLKKFATGNGKADKGELKARYKLDTGAENKNSDQVDAYYMRQYGVALLAEATGEFTDERLERMSAAVLEDHRAVAQLILAGKVVC